MEKWMPLIIVGVIIFALFAFLSGRKGGGFDITLGMNKNKIAEKEEEHGEDLKQSVRNDVDNYSKSSATSVGSKSAASSAADGSQGGLLW